MNVCMYTKHQPKLGVCSLVSLILGVSEIRTSSNYNNRLALGKVIKLGEIHTERDALFKVPKFFKHSLLHCNIGILVFAQSLYCIQTEKVHLLLLYSLPMKS